MTSIYDEIINIKKCVGLALKELRESKNLTLRQVENKAYSLGFIFYDIQIAKYERAETQMRFDTLLKLLHVYNCSLVDFFKKVQNKLDKTEGLLS